MAAAKKTTEPAPTKQDTTEVKPDSFGDVYEADPATPKAECHDPNA